MGSLELVFEPKRVRPGDYSFDIGTAGSTSLVFQSLLPPLLFAGGNSTLILKGGTHVPFSPPFHYISEVFIPILGPLGMDVGAEIETYGFYPKGGGRIFYSINPCRGIRQSDFTERGNLLGIKGISAVGNLPKSIARKQMDSLLKGRGEFKAEIETREVDTHGQGTFVFIRAEFEGALTGFSALGKRGKRAEKVGEEAAAEFFEYFRSGASLDRHMADQIVLYLALAEGKSTFTTSRISEHLRTNLHVIGKFMDVRSEIEPPHRVTIAGRRPH